MEEFKTLASEKKIRSTRTNIQATHNKANILSFLKGHMSGLFTILVGQNKNVMGLNQGRLTHLQRNLNIVRLGIRK